ncbi:MAG: serine--tRNA ligase, partial [Maribacter sp.]|nr:serine--tRNA ligase [Maribacter sp.]
MLQLQVIREDKDKIIRALQKRTIDVSPMLDNIIQLDEKRRSTQSKLDNTLAESNKLSKEIGLLFKSGKAQEANALKEKTVSLKEDSKRLGDALNTAAEELQNLLYQIPNVPHELVPTGSTEADNEVVYKEGGIPSLKADALPHWELAKKYDIIDFELG